MAPAAPTTDTVYIVRHGERIDHTEVWQPDPAHGIIDPPLSSKGHIQSQRTGEYLGRLIQQQQQQQQQSTAAATVTAPNIIIYTSPFQRCIDTSIDLIKGLQPFIDLHYPPILRMDFGLIEWMSDQFYDEIYCSGSQFLARHQEQLARRQAMHYHQQHYHSPPSPPSSHYDDDDDNHHGKTKKDDPFWLPPMTIDYAYHSQFHDFDFPESYSDMLQRFDQTRRHCLDHVSVNLPKKYFQRQSSPSVIIMVTHGIGVNALLDSFRNTVTRPIKTPYCCISRFQYKRPVLEEADDDAWLDPFSSKLNQQKWIPDMIVSDSHLSISDSAASMSGR